jgi:hypothetical protein
MPTTIEATNAFYGAVDRARRAPSILNTQPWRWRIGSSRMRLYADRARQIRSIDPDGRMLIVSCGATLHHARVALSALGFDVLVERFEEPTEPDLLATVQVVGRHEPAPKDIQNLRDIRARHSDRRPFVANVPVPAQTMDRLTRAAAAEDAWLYRLGPTQTPVLAVAEEGAAAAEEQMPEYQADLEIWTNRSRRDGDGVRPEAVTAQMPRRVAVRNFAPGGETLLEPGFGDDQFTEFLVVVTQADGPVQWLRAGEATSATWLTATGAGLVASAMSDVIEIPVARALVQRMLDPPGFAQLVLRVAVDMQPTPAPNTPRRAVDEVADTGPDLPETDA